MTDLSHLWQKGMIISEIVSRIAPIENEKATYGLVIEQAALLKT